MLYGFSQLFDVHSCFQDMPILSRVVTQKEGRSGAENTSPRGDRTETGLRTKPIADQLQPGAYDLYRTCRLRITGKHLASS